MLWGSSLSSPHLTFLTVGTSNQWEAQGNYHVFYILALNPVRSPFPVLFLELLVFYFLWNLWFNPGVSQQMSWYQAAGHLHLCLLLYPESSISLDPGWSPWLQLEAEVGCGAQTGNWSQGCSPNRPRVYDRATDRVRDMPTSMLAWEAWALCQPANLSMGYGINIWCIVTYQ